VKVAADTLRTGRLELRWLTADDAPLMLAIWNDPDFIRQVVDRGVRTTAEARDAMHGMLALYRTHGYGAYRVAPAGGGPAMGICGLFKRDIFEEPDIGYALLPAWRGQGYTFEAARAVLAEARDGLGLARVNAIVSPGNRASIRLLEKLGMREQGPVRMPGEDADILLFARSFAQ
jgi:RimJ/RimL family protein N-acetyltransferase